MKQNNLIKALKEKPMNFTLTEIRKIMDEELNKDPQDMNTSLIDLCAEAIKR